jgi:hypothetical protein
MRLKHYRRLGGMTVGQVFQVSSLSIFGDKGFQGTEVKGSIGAR